jgi:hypothetical protein
MRSKWGSKVDDALDEMMVKRMAEEEAEGEMDAQAEQALVQSMSTKTKFNVLYFKSKLPPCLISLRIISNQIYHRL